MTARPREARMPVSEEMRVLLDALPVPVALLGEDDEVLHANAAMRAHLGRNPGGLDPVHATATPFGRCVALPAAPAAPQAHPGDPQMQRLASLGFMLAGVCHEVSNPLAAIHSMVQILQSRRGVTQETLEKGLGSIASNIARLLAITRKVGDFSRVTGDAPRPVPLDAAVQEAAALLRHGRFGASVQVEYRGLQDALTLARPGELQQVVLNLLLNAAQAMKGAGRIEVQALALPEGRLRLSVRDEGPGIPPDQLERVFEPFFTTKPPGEGTGLGLAISYEIVHELGGTMQAANHPGGGACMQVDLLRHGPQP